MVLMMMFHVLTNFHSSGLLQQKAFQNLALDRSRLDFLKPTSCQDFAGELASAFNSVSCVLLLFRLWKHLNKSIQLLINWGWLCICMKISKVGRLPVFSRRACFSRKSTMVPCNIEVRWWYNGENCTFIVSTLVQKYTY